MSKAETGTENMIFNLYDGKTILTAYDERLQSIIWQPLINPVNLIDWEPSFRHGVDFLKRYPSRVRGWLNRVENLGWIENEQLQFILREVNPFASQLTPALKVAFTQPKDNFANASIHCYCALTNNNKDNILLRNGLTLQEAENWLLSDL